MPTYAEALKYLGIDYAENDAVIKYNVERALKTAEQTVRGAVGRDVFETLTGDSRLSELVLIFTDDLYTNRGVSAKVSGATRRLVGDMCEQLRQEYAIKKEEAVE